MRPVTFRHAEYLLHNPNDFGGRFANDLPIRYADGQCISCWEPSWRERLSILLHGRVWLGVRMPKANQPQVWLKAQKEMFTTSCIPTAVTKVENGRKRKEKSHRHFHAKGGKKAERRHRSALPSATN